MGAWVSDQSAIIDSREVLEEQLKALEKQYIDKIIPKPSFWGGYCIQPIEFEFWQGRPNRLHDRIRYAQKQDTLWEMDRLSP